MPGDGHGRAGLAEGSWQQLRELLGQILVSPLARSHFHPLQFPKGLVRKGRKKNAVKGFPLPKHKPQGLQRGLGSHRNVWECGRFRDRARGV